MTELCECSPSVPSHLRRLPNIFGPGPSSRIRRPSVNNLSLRDQKAKPTYPAIGYAAQPAVFIRDADGREKGFWRDLIFSCPGRGYCEGDQPLVEIYTKMIERASHLAPSHDSSYFLVREYLSRAYSTVENTPTHDALQTLYKFVRMACNPDLHAEFFTFSRDTNSCSTYTLEERNKQMRDTIRSCANTST